MTRGLFITFEGIEGCGKTTQIRLLADYLRAAGRSVVLTREPGGTPAAEAIRAILLDPARDELAPTTELLLYAAARAQHVHQVIRPAMDAGAVVLCDRFADSTEAYQGGGRELSRAVIQTLRDIAAGGTWPDCTLLLDLSAAGGLSRTRNRGALDRIEGEPLAFHERVRAAFLDIAAREPDRVAVVNAAASVETVAGEVRARIDVLLREAEGAA